MWPFVSRKAKRFVNNVIESSKLNWVEWDTDRKRQWYETKSVIEFEYDGHQLKIGVDLFGYTVGSLYFYRFNYRDRNYIWSELIKEAKGIRN